MNTIYKLVWNATAGTFVAASELAKGRKKKSRVVGALAVAIALGLNAGAALAADETGTTSAIHVLPARRWSTTIALLTT